MRRPEEDTTGGDQKLVPHMISASTVYNYDKSPLRALADARRTARTPSVDESGDTSASADVETTDSAVEENNSSHARVETTRRSFGQRLGTGMALTAATVLGGIVFSNRHERIGKEKAGLNEAAKVALGKAYELWEELKSNSVEIEKRKSKLFELRRELFNFQLHTASRRGVGWNYVERNLPNHTTISDEDLLADTKIPLALFQHICGQIEQLPVVQKSEEVQVSVSKSPDTPLSATDVSISN